MTQPAAADGVSGLWLATFQRAVARASHDVKDALNGVSVNLEVVRSRAVRPDAPASAVAPFAEAAGHQLERLTTLIEAVLALGRPEREPADVGVVLRRVATLCSASASSADAAVEVRHDHEGETITSVAGVAVRLAIASALLDVVAGTDGRHPASTVTCELRGDESSVVVRIVAAGRRAAVPPPLAGPLRASGVRWADGDMTGDFSLAFPRA